ncbi:Hypothetical protein SRAE_0000003200 [Strongyloides ratti]|uniref:TLDc domain-containing protein n=1 Tax=Strongyloides ratti TaxID=34506 RepID=A0A090KTQ1_STRRB|nr:Hypothetical protein SRAE_0000003200 [Strongyloides ratti]CEF60900.1 Hypothetical protein SRAE_0000003200 [Strongyloides ratti]
MIIPKLENSYENIYKYISHINMDINYKEYYDKFILKYKCLDNIAISEIFGEAFTTPLWDFYTSNVDVTEISSKLFLEKTPYFFLNIPDIYVEIFKCPRILLNACFFCAGVKIEDDDEEIIDDIVEKMNFYTDITQSMILWIKQNTPQICDSLKNYITNKITGKNINFYNFKSKVLTPVQMFLIKSSFTTYLFLNTDEFLHKSENKKKYWYILHDLTLTDTSILSLKKWVLNSKMSIVFILKIVDNSIYVFAIDKHNNENEKYSNNYGLLTILCVKPRFYKLVDNEIIDINTFENIFKNYLKIKKNFSNVSDVEIWINETKNNNKKLYIDNGIIKKSSIKNNGFKNLENKFSDEIIISIGGKCSKMTRRISTTSNI